MTDEDGGSPVEEFAAELTPAEMRALIRSAYGPPRRHVQFADVVSSLKLLARWSLFALAVFAFFVFSEGWRDTIQQVFHAEFAALSIALLVEAFFKAAILALIALPALVWAFCRAIQDYKDKAWLSNR